MKGTYEFDSDFFPAVFDLGRRRKREGEDEWEAVLRLASTPAMNQPSDKDQALIAELSEKIEELEAMLEEATAPKENTSEKTEVRKRATRLHRKPVKRIPAEGLEQFLTDLMRDISHDNCRLTPTEIYNQLLPVYKGEPVEWQQVRNALHDLFEKEIVIRERIPVKDKRGDKCHHQYWMPLASKQNKKLFSPPSEALVSEKEKTEETSEEPPPAKVRQPKKPPLKLVSSDPKAKVVTPPKPVQQHLPISPDQGKENLAVPQNTQVNW